MVRDGVGICVHFPWWISRRLALFSLKLEHTSVWVVCLVVCRPPWSREFSRAMSTISPYTTQGKWSHSSGGEIDINVDSTGQSVIINHPTVGKQTLEVRKFCAGDGLDYFGFKGKIEGNKITWNNGVVWTKLA